MYLGSVLVAKSSGLKAYAEVSSDLDAVGGNAMGGPPWAFVVLGALAGLLSGMLGLGSGTVLVPALVLLFHLPQKSAQGTCLAVMVPMALLGAWRYWQNPAIKVHPGVVGLIVLGALCGTLVGTQVAYSLPGHILKKIFAAFLVLVAIKMLLSSGNTN